MKKTFDLSILISLWGLISPKRQRQIFYLFLLVIVASFAEMVSIGLVVPFLVVIATPNHFFLNEQLNNQIEIISNNLGFQSGVPVITLLFCFATLLSGAIRILLVYLNTKVSFLIGADLSAELYRRTLYQNYQVHVGRNSSEIISAISTKTNAIINNALLPSLAIISSLTLMVTIFITLLFIDPKMSTILFFGFGIIYIGVSKFVSKRLKNNSFVIAAESTNVIKSLNEGLGGIRDVLISNLQETYCKIYQTSDVALRAAQASNQFIAASPKFFIESIGMILIAIAACSLALKNGGNELVIPILGSMAMGAIRLMPMMQQMYNSWSSLASGQASVTDAIKLLQQPAHKHLEKRIFFRDCIELNDVSLRHPHSTSFALSNVSLTIKKGEIIGFMGPTGGGKSTLIDVAMGLLMPTGGSVRIDGITIDHVNAKSWYPNIAHVPQSIFLADASIAENIAFGVGLESVDILRIKKIIEIVDLTNVINSMPFGLNTKVGERGIRLSGGQCQRIGIARALYRNADVLFLDEATSALDVHTEKKIINSVMSFSKNLTILMVAHRLSTLEICHRIYEVSAGKINKSGNFSEMVREAYKLSD